MVQWFKAQGRGYQTKMNAVLRAFYERQLFMNAIGIEFK